MLIAISRAMCFFGAHCWKYGGIGVLPGQPLNARQCEACGRREVCAFRSRSVKGYEQWKQHTYPPSEDPLKDTTPIVDGYGDKSTIAYEVGYSRRMRNVLAS